jgi:hypothetical protein
MVAIVYSLVLLTGDPPTSSEIKRDPFVKPGLYLRRNSLETCINGMTGFPLNWERSLTMPYVAY